MLLFAGDARVTDGITLNFEAGRIMTVNVGILNVIIHSFDNFTTTII